MYIKKLTLSHFGKFHKKEIECKPGINIIYGENEAGKSTIHSFLRGMLFGIEKQRGRAGKDDLYTKYQPMDMPGSYEGSMEFSYRDENYRIYRRFYQKEKSSQVINLTLGKELKIEEGSLTSFFPELTESSYRNTISIEQLRAKTDAELASEVRNFIANLTTSKASEVDVGKALSTLIEKKKAIENSGIVEKIKCVSSEIEEALANERQMEETSKSLKELLKQREEWEASYQTLMAREISPFLQRASELPVIVQKYSRYEELQEEISSLEEKIQVMKKSMQTPINKKEVSILEDQIGELEVLMKEQRLLELEMLKENPEQVSLHKEQKKGRMIGAIPALLGAILCVLPFGNGAVRTALGIGLVILGIMLYFLMEKRVQRKNHDVDRGHKELEKQLLMIGSSIKDILVKNHCIDIEQLKNKYNELIRGELRRDHQEKQLVEYQGTLMEKQKKRDNIIYDILNYMNYFMDSPEVSRECVRQLQEQVRKQQQEFQEKQRAFEEERLQLVIQLDRLQHMQQAFHEKENVLNQKQAEYEELLIKQKEQQTELAAIMLAIQTLKELSAHIHDSFGASLSSNVSEQMEKITGGKYKEVLVDENLNVKVLHEEQYIPLERLSVGTIEQVYFALRLTIADLFFEGESMPLMFDDSFAYYDDNRTKAVLRMLANMKERQIFIFTCHHREQEFLNEAGIPYSYIEL